MKKLAFELLVLDSDFPGYTHQNVHEQVRKMFIYQERGWNPFTEQPYGFWDTYRHTSEDIEEVRREMLKYCVDY